MKPCQSQRRECASLARLRSLSFPLRVWWAHAHQPLGVVLPRGRGVEVSREVVLSWQRRGWVERTSTMSLRERGRWTTYALTDAGKEALEAS